jgi:hypothetical protein
MFIFKTDMLQQDLSSTYGIDVKHTFSVIHDSTFFKLTD